MNLRKRLLAAGTALLAFSGAAQAEKYIFQTWLNPSYVFTAEGNIGFADAVRAASNGEIDFDVMTGGVLFPANGTIEGIGNGVAHAGPVPPSYHPSQFPLANAIGDIGFANPDPMLLTYAYADFTMNDPAARAEWQRNGLVYAAAGATPIYYLMCRGDVKTLEDVQGKRIRVPGGGLARIAEAFGGIAVNIAGSEMYTALERGAIDCAIGDATQLTSGTNIIELVGSVILQPMNPAYLTGMIVYNPDFWRGLTDDQRRLLLDEGAAAMVRTQIAFTAEADTALEAARQRGIDVQEPDPSIARAYDDFVEGGTGGMAEVARTTYKIEDPEALFANFTSYIDKWAKLLDGVDRRDEAALTALVRQNLYDGIDVASYGMQ
ncbi:C4-dicarboxylate TRAP transporter substrate-binding protein [Paracoccus sp. (in: a-proteobacteria)]|uniref:C4-dicarboxylate TRAP transporter substrate-binding protein n=1 Tax=Paracoccus sp. TaxID=267 RepID=UPI002AFF7B93|nr:C4-dicarboxylate TRAP transporter substrate-binding protein [Paracoccus sp. (in: a-proteobacteria)]